MSQTAILQIVFAASLACVTACGSSNSHRQSVRDQNEANVEAQRRDLKPAEAQYAGTMTMTKSHQTFDVDLTIKRVYETARESQSPDPTQTVTLPKLSGYMTFPALADMDVSQYTNFSELINPMGGFATVLFDFGDYDPVTHVLVLPYNVSGYNQGNFGELEGELHDGEFTGTWFAKPLGVVGKFKLEQRTN